MATRSKKRLTNLVARTLAGPRRELARTAVHESGHAVVAQLLGLAPEHVIIQKSNDRDGQVYFHGQCQTGRSGPEDSPETVKREIVMILAGGAAERRLDPGKLALDGLDWAAARLAGRRLYGILADPGEIESELRRLLSIADKMLAEHWADVLATAGALVELHELIESVQGWIKPAEVMGVDVAPPILVAARDL